MFIHDRFLEHNSRYQVIFLLLYSCAPSDVGVLLSHYMHPFLLFYSKPDMLAIHKLTVWCVLYFLSCIFDCGSFCICLIGLISEELAVMMYSNFDLQA